MGVPQGSILSVTLFVLKINQLANEIDPDIMRALFVDDFTICFRSRSMETIERKLQNNLDKINKWAQLNGFKFSVNKTVCMHFWKYKGTRGPELRLNDKAIKHVEHHKFLGLIWDRGLTFEQHIQYLKAKCLKTLNLLRVLSHTTWGSDTPTLLKLFKAFIRSKLDYGCMVYQSASHTTLKKLMPVQNEALRVCTGAFRTSPTSSLHIVCNETPPFLRHIQLSMQYIVKLRANAENPAYEYVFEDNASGSDTDSDEDFNPRTRKNLPKTFSERHQEYMNESNIELNTLAQCKVPAQEPWLLSEPTIDLDLTAYSKNNTLPSAYKALFKEKVEEYQNYTHIYTDGSKVDEKVGAASTWEFGTLKTRLPNKCTIFSAEAIALINALKTVKASQRKQFIVFTDSLSCLQSIQNEDISNQLILTFLELYTVCTLQDKRIVLCWIPSHIGIPGNEEADKYAKEAIEEDITPMEIPYTDFIPEVKAYINDLWQRTWDGSTDFLSMISPEVGKTIYNPNLTRKEQVVLTRLRIGHTRLTHSYLMKNEEPPRCSFCKVRLTVQHIMEKCRKLTNLRAELITGENMQEILYNSDTNIIRFLKESGIYSEI